jgi:hypothetical protein
MARREGKKEMSLIDNLLGQGSSLTSLGIEDTLKNIQQDCAANARQCEDYVYLGHRVLRSVTTHLHQMRGDSQLRRHAARALGVK